MQISQPDISALVDFGQKGRRLISVTCDQPGRLVLNDQGGNDEANVAGKAALLSPSRRDEILLQLGQKADRLRPDQRPKTIVFHGQAQPDLLDNPQFTSLIDRLGAARPQDLEAFARQAPEQGGLGVSDWLSAERPLALFFGQEFNVRGHASSVLRRRPNENVLIVGESQTERVAMVASAILSATCTEGAGSVEPWVCDRSILRTDWANTLQQTTEALGGIGVSVRFTRNESDVPAYIENAAREVERRKALPEDARIDQSSVLLVINEPDRVAELVRPTDDFGFSDSELGNTLRAVLMQGSAVGVHVILSATGVGTIKTVISEKSILNDFRHRIGMQMSEDDSFAYVRSSAAYRLQPEDEPKPVCALLYDSQRQRSVKFKPYSIKQSEGFESPHGEFISQVNEATRRVLAKR